MRKLLLQPLKLLLLACLLAVVTAPGTAYGQLAFTRTTFTSAYTPIATGTGALASTAVGDDVVEDMLPIGFAFTYLGNTFNNFGVSSNGFMQLQTATGLASSNANVTFHTSGSPVNCLAPWWDDLGGTVGVSSLLYQTLGAAPNRRLVVQWTAWNSFYTGSTSTINFQVVLYETTNVIEFNYGPLTAGTFNTSESASIGLKGATGGNGNYLDAVTGSAFVGHGFMQAQTKWLPYSYRFTPGAPTALAGGTYTVGVGQTYGSLDRAVADINHRGVSGPVVLSLTDANYGVLPAEGDNIFPVVFGPVAGTSLVNTITVQPSGASPATLTYEGAVTGYLANQANLAAVGTTNEGIIVLLGSSFNVFNNLNLTSGTAAGSINLDRAILVSNGSGTVGSQFNGFRNITASLNRNNLNSIAIEQRTIQTPTAVTGANSNCAYMNLNISNTYAGIWLSGTAAFPDLNTTVGVIAPTTFNIIGGAAAGDIGGNTTQTFGIRASSQSGANIFNNEVRNVSGNAVATDGILIELAQGTTSVYNNKVHDIRNVGTGSTTAVNGIRANSATTGTTSLRVYNNFVYNILHAYTGAATATRIIRGIFVQAAGGGSTTNVINADNNSISIDGTAAGTGSNTCFEIGTASGAVINTRNNIFANFTTGQVNGTSYHVGFASTSATAVGNTGSVSDRNDFYIADVTAGHVGRGNTTNYTTLAAWQGGMTGQDVNSITANPLFTGNNSNLHASGIPLNAAASTIAYITTDIDGDPRAATPDIGADEFTVVTTDPGLYGMTGPVAGQCYTSTQPVTVTLSNTGGAALDFSAVQCTINVAVTGAVTTNLQLILTNNSLNGGAPLAVGASIVVTVGTVNMTTSGTYNFTGNVVMAGDGNSANNTLTPVSINFSAGTVTAAKGSLCQGDSTLLTLAGNTNAASIQWQSASAVGGPWTNIVGATGQTYMSHPTANTYYRATICGFLPSVHDTVLFLPTSAPVTVGDTVCGRDTLVLTATAPGTISWFAGPSGGGPIHTGPVLDTVLNATTTFYAASISGLTTGSVGLFDNSGGGGQQTSTAYNIFDVYQNTTLVGVYAYPGAAGNVVFELLNSAGVSVTTRTVAVTAGQIGLRTYIPLNIPLTVGTGWRLAQGAGSVSMFRNSAGVAFPYTLPGVLQIHNSSAGTSFYYFGYDWQVSVGCESARTPVVATVLTAPAMSASLLDTVICEDYNTTLSASSIDPTYVYTWTPSASLSAATGDSVTASPLATTTYVVTAVSAANCIIQDTITLEVNSHPKPVFGASDSLICIGDTVMLGFATPQAFWADSNDVSVPDNTTQTSTINVSNFPGTLGANSISQVCLDMTHTWDADMNFTLIAPNGATLDLSSGNGGSGDNFIGTCFSMTGVNGPVTGGSAPFTGSYIPEGAAGFGAFAGSSYNGAWVLQMQDVATGDPGLLLNWSIEFNTNPAMYSWTSVPAGFTATTGSVWVTPSATTTYSVNVSDSITGCDTTYSYTVNVNPPLSISTNAPSGAVCPGTTVNLVATVTGGNGSYIYDWAGQSSTNSLSLVINANTTIILTVMDTCSTPVAYDTINIMVAQPLAVTTAGNNICEGTSAVLTANATGGDGNYSYVWSHGPTTNPVTVSPVTTTTYSVTVTDGCGLTPATTSATVTVDPLPVAAFTTGNSASGTVFTNASTNGTSYFWTFGDGATSTLQNPTHLYATSTSFTACLTTTNTCGSDTICSAIVSNEQSFGNGSVQLWPNPSNGKFNVRVSGLQGGDLTMTLFNMNGQRLLDKAFGTSFNTVEHTFSNELPAGAYFLRVNDGVHTATLRLMVE